MKYTLLLLLSTSFIFSQNKDKIKFNYLSFGTGIYKQQNFNSGGFTVNIDLSFKYKKNLVILCLAGGLGGNDKNSIFIVDALNSYSEYDILYGREFALYDWFKIEGQLGIGTFSQDISIIEENNSTIGFPIRAKLLFYPSKRFAIGINPNYNINSINNIISYNLIFQFKF